MKRGPQSMAGFDPFDALRGSRVPGFVRRSARARQAVIQLRKRSRADLAPLLGIRTFLMAKTVGTFLAAEARRYAAGEDGADPSGIAEVLLGDPDIARHADGAWGYEFDVQTRWAFYPAGSANIIATYFCARGLGEAGVVCDEPRWIESMHDSARFVERVLGTSEGWFRYTVDSDVLVHNANLLGAGLVACSGGLGSDDAMVERALSAALVSVRAQSEDGSWPYGARTDLTWRDNFHTAYDLDGLLSVWLATGDVVVERAMRRGAERWAGTFFEPDGAPRYYDHKAEPYDVHSAGTAIDVASRLAACGIGTGELAERVAEWTRAHLIASDGSTYYQLSGGRVDRRHFVRWGDAHVALGMASLRCLQVGAHLPLEHALLRASATSAAGTPSASGERGSRV